MFKNQFQNKTILIAEDDPFSFKLLFEFLSITGAKILHAKNGIEAVKFAKKNPNIDLILMDIRLPLKDGVEATKDIRRFRENIPIIAQTAGAMACEIEKFYASGIDDYITKPYKQSDILRKVQKFLVRNLQVIA